MSFLPMLRSEVKRLAKLFSIPDDQAFAAWFATVAWDLDEDYAVDALGVEGPNEKGMDLFWVENAEQRVFIAQCKYSPKGTHRPRVKDLNTILSCTDWLTSPQALEREGRPELVEAAKEYNQAIDNDYSVQLWFVYTGDRDENIDKRIRVFNANPENEQRRRSAIHCDLELLESMYRESRGEERRIPQAQTAVDTRAFEVKGHFNKGLVSSIAGRELVALYDKYGDKLFARNVRGWLGARKGSVNAGIITTAMDDRERGNFWAYNNGITIVCDDYEFDAHTGQLDLRNFSIVNGCQTTVALARSGDAATTDDVTVLVRIICPPESIIDSVIRFTNSQNLIRRWDLASQDRTQRRLQRDFAILREPVYYAIRRGEWGSLSRDEKRKYRPDGRGPTRMIKHDLLAQYLASYKGMPVVAYKNKAFLFDRYYDQTFPPDLRVEEAYFIWRAGDRTQELVREEIRTEIQVQRGNTEREKYARLLRRGGRFYALAIFGLIAELRNGPDYLRSIDEVRITSKGATERIDKYATLSIRLYKQAADALLTLSGVDMPVLIREANYFDRIKEQTTNSYALLSVNVDWLDGALPKLY